VIVLSLVLLAAAGVLLVLGILRGDGGTALLAASIVSTLVAAALLYLGVRPRGRAARDRTAPGRPGADEADSARKAAAPDPATATHTATATRTATATGAAKAGERTRVLASAPAAADTASGRVTEKASGRDAEKASGRVTEKASGRDAEKASGRVTEKASGRDAEKVSAATSGRVAAETADRGPAPVADGAVDRATGPGSGATGSAAAATGAAAAAAARTTPGRTVPGSPAGPPPGSPDGVPPGGSVDEDPPDEPGIETASLGDLARVAGRDDEVLVVDGRPRYHVAGCGHLTDRESEGLPVSEAAELGFTPCARCAPVAALLA
jgi:hypothetical protein